jgi:hypothetical protein
MSKRQAQVTVLCEDRQQEVFARTFLIGRGFDGGRIRVRITPKGKQAGEQFVRESYPMEVKAYRSRKNHLSLCLVVILDADTSTVAERLSQLDAALEKHSQAKRQQEERIGVFVPRRNIETWIHYLQGDPVDELTKYSKLPHESECKADVQSFAQATLISGLSNDAPPSLQAACPELERIQ